MNRLGTVRGSPSPPSRRLKDVCAPHKKKSLSSEQVGVGKKKDSSPVSMDCVVRGKLPSAVFKEKMQSLRLPA